MMKRATWMLAVLLASRVVLAHDLWIERTGSEFVVGYGHRGGIALPMVAEKVQALRCRVGKAARDVRGEASFSTTAITLRDRCDAVSVLYEGGYYSLTPDGEQNLPKNRVTGAVRSWQSREISKWLDVHAANATTTLGDELELVPMGSLEVLRVGDKLTLQVLHGGQPLAGAVVAYGERVVGETDSTGAVRLKLRNPGAQGITATMRRKLNSPEADEQIVTASLWFELVP